FDVQIPAISKHLQNIYDENELKKEATISKMETVQIEGERNVKNVFTMEDFSASINKFLSFREYKILPDKGSVSKQKAALKAEAEYTEFNKTQKITSDFDRQVKKLVEKVGDSDE
ncbi:MAG: RhuM family protein, partial [Eubacteriales bacterium]|nr:RhuM family protein [Eubacteriales bacterium]